MTQTANGKMDYLMVKDVLYILMEVATPALLSKEYQVGKEGLSVLKDGTTKVSFLKSKHKEKVFLSLKISVIVMRVIGKEIYPMEKATKYGQDLAS